MASDAGVDIKSDLRELKKLEKMGILNARRAGKERHYRLNEKFPLHVDLASIFSKTRKNRRYAFRGLQPDV